MRAPEERSSKPHALDLRAIFSKFVAHTIGFTTAKGQHAVGVTMSLARNSDRKRIFVSNATTL
jgi:hypothetical protein